ncbi:nitroreductase family protein [Sphingomonas sp.]|uniref:nitroreductase family protein n=1 Tax=Sphingomonas sp. TaxID=28214 RepID=UPI00325F9572
MTNVPHSPYASLPALSDEERIAAARKFREEVAGRRTCRMFSPAPVPRGVIEEAILAAGSAPSGANHQPWHFAVVTSPELKARIRVEAEKQEAVMVIVTGLPASDAVVPDYALRKKPLEQITSWL